MHDYMDGSAAQVGEVPAKMQAYAIRSDRMGQPNEAFARETLEVPTPGPGEVLVRVMAAGINYNNVWAARGVPVDVIKLRQKRGEPHDFHIGGSDASGYVWATGEGVEGVTPGDPVVVHPGYWDTQDPWVLSGRDPMLAPSARIWGYDTNFGSFAEFALVKAHQVMPKARRLSWAEAAASTLVGTTAYRMLFGWQGHELEQDDVVLVWGGSGGVGSLGIQLASDVGARAVAVVSSDERGRYCEQLGAVGYINRRDFDHWGTPPHWTDDEGTRDWSKGARAFGKAIWDVVGEKVSPRLVLEHPGESTIPTSIFVCDTGGMVVICAGTTGYSATVDLRYHWTRQKRLQGSHGTNTDQAVAYNQLLVDGRIDPCLGPVSPFDDIPQLHQKMGDGEDIFGNAVVLVGADDQEEGRDVGVE